MAQQTQQNNGRKKLLKGRLPELFVLLFCMILLGIGVSRKEGFHMDELLSFELSNAEFTPWIVPTQPEGRLAKFVNQEIKAETFSETVANIADTVTDVLKNRGSSKLLSYRADVYEEPVWITAEQFRDYLTVDGDAFNYLSVYFNVKDDNHPPIHFMLLHTISSVFQGQAKSWMGCAINMVCVAVCMLLLMGLGRLLAPVCGCEKHGRALGLLAALLYGCSTGAMATTLLIRMYGVLTCFCVALFYFHVKKWLSEGEGFSGHNKGLIAVTVLGYLTQYFFLFYCLILAAVTAVLLWCGKRRRELWIYIRSMVTAGIIGVGIFPFSIGDVFSSGRGVEALGNLSSGLSGYGTRLAAFTGILADRTFGGIVLLLLVVSAIVLLGMAVIEHGVHLIMLIVPALGYFLLAARMSPYLVDRYIMPLFPFVMLLGAVIIMSMAERWERAGKGSIGTYLLCGIILALQLWRVAHYDGTYLYQGYAEQEQLAEDYEGYPCLCIYDGVGYYENLQEFTHYASTLLLKETELENRKDIESVASQREVVVLLKSSVDRGHVFDLLKEKYGLLLQEELLENGVQGDSLYLFAGTQE